MKPPLAKFAAHAEKVPISRLKVPNAENINRIRNPPSKTYTIGEVKKLVSVFFIFSFIVYLLTSAGRTPFDYFTRLSASFLQGKYYLTESAPWLTELIPTSENKFYVVYPPMPAVTAMPFVLLFGNKFEQQYLAHLLGAGIVALTMLISWKIKKDKKLLIWVGLLTGFGNIMWFLSATGSSWYLGQITAAFFLTAGIFETLGKRRPFLMGILLGAAFLSRIHTAVSLPFFLYFLIEKKWLKNFFYFGLGFAPFILFNFYYNFLRFGTIFDMAYFILPAVLGEQKAPWFLHGVANPVYIPNNIKAMFWSFPKILKDFPYIEPSWAGLSIWITTPAFIYALRAEIKDKVNILSWISILLIFLIVASHGGTGWAQFGYRFAVDFYPFLLLLTIKGVARGGVRWHHVLLLIICLVVNLWGVLWINKFGWVNY